MQFPIFHIDAFTNKVFTGNPAAVCLLDKWLEENILFSIAKENNLPATVFLVRENNIFHIRWLASEYELVLCGHGTLAASFVVFNFIEPRWNRITFKSHIAGNLDVLNENGYITLNFPVKQIERFSKVPLHLVEGLGLAAKEIYQHEDRCLVIYSSEEEVKNLTPNFQLLKAAAFVGITVTAPGKHYDFVSRTFYPKKSITEDPATGSSHCLLGPYWAKQLNKMDLYAKQISERGGEMHCQLQGDRVLIKAQCVLFKKGEIAI